MEKIQREKSKKGTFPQWGLKSFWCISARIKKVCQVHGSGRFGKKGSFGLKKERMKNKVFKNDFQWLGLGVGLKVNGS